MPGIGEVHIDQALGNVSIMYANDADTYIAERVLPILPVEKRSDKYFRYKKESFLSGSGVGANGLPLSIRAPKGVANEIDYGNDTAFYDCHEMALSDIVPDEVDQAADNPLDPQIDATTFITERLLIDNEMMTARLAANPANYPSTNKVALTTGSTGTSWAPGSAGGTTTFNANSNPFTFIGAAKIAVVKGIAKQPNQFVMGHDVAQYLSNHPQIVDRVKYTSAETLTQAGLPKVLQGLTVVEGGAQVNFSVPGVAYSGGYIWEPADGTAGLALISYSNPMPRPRSVTFAYTFEAPSSTTRVRGYSIRKWRDEDRHGLKIEGTITRDWRGMAVDGNGLLIGGYLGTNVIG